MDGDDAGRGIFRRDPVRDIEQSAHHRAVGAHPAHIVDSDGAAGGLGPPGHDATHEDKN